MNRAEAVDKASRQHSVKASPLLLGEAVLTLVLLRIGEVYWTMSDVQVTAEDNRLSLTEFLHVPGKSRIPLIKTQW